MPALSSKDFSTPIMVTSGDRRPQRIWLAVGEALTTWEITEASFASLFGFLLFPAGISGAAQRAYGQMTNNKSRSDLISGALDVFFHSVALALNKDQGLVDDMRTLLNAYKGASGRRNQIAHGITYPQGSRKTGYIGYVLVPPIYNHAKRGIDLSENYRHNSKTIRESQELFRRLGGDCADLTRRLRTVYIAAQKAKELARAKA